MKAVKIVLAIIGVGIIGYLLWLFIGSTPCADCPPPPTKETNEFVEKIRNDIDSLKKRPDDPTLKSEYDNIILQIDDFHEKKKFSEVDSENDQIKENFEKNLYSVYTEKFIAATFNTLKSSNWCNDKPDNIRKEVQLLQGSHFLERNSPTDDQFNEIKSVLNKYDEIKGFIASCKNFGYSNYSLNSQFPINEAANLISKAKKYRTDSDSQYLKNCSQIKDELNKIPEAVFQAHVRYLDKMIDQWSFMYNNYNSQKTYVDNLYKPILAKIDQLANSIYNSSYKYPEIVRLKNKWEKDGLDAYFYFNPQSSSSPPPPSKP